MKNHRLRYIREDSRSGLTLVELAVVLLVLGIIMTIVFVGLGKSVTEMPRKAMAVKIQSDSARIPMLLSNFERDVRPLQGDEDLSVLSASDSENSAYRPVNKKAIRDPWKRPYFLKLNDHGRRWVCSLGKDGQEGGQDENADFCLDDFNNWPKWIDP